MANRIKGITIEIGGDTTGLQTALKDVNSNVNKTQRELKDVKKLLNLDPTNTELLAQKQELLSKQIANVSEKLDTLKEAERQAQAQFERGDISEEQYRALQREVTATEIELKELNKEASETAGAEKDLSDNAKDAADDVKKVEESSGSASSVLEGLGTAAKAAAAATAAAFAAATAAVAAATKALADCTVEGAAYADGVLTESTVTGIATDKLQGYMYAAELVDVSTETLTKSMAKNIKSMTSAAEGSGAAAEAYAALGVSVTNADGSLRDGEEVYWELIDALGGVEDETTRDSLAMQVLGKSAQELNPLITAGSDRMRELGAEAEAAGYVMSGDTLNAYGALDDAMQRLDVGATAAKNALGTVLLPILTEMSETGVGLLNEFSAGVQDANGDIEKIGDVINGIIPKVVAAVTDLAPELFDIVGNAIETIADAIVNNAPELMDAAEDLLDAIIKTIERVLPQLINTATQLIGKLMKSLTKELPKILRLVISSIKDIVQAISKDAGKFAQAAVDIIVEVADALTDNIGVILKAVVKIVTDVAKAITKPENINKLINAVVDLIGELAGAIIESSWEIIKAAFSVIGNIAIGIANIFGANIKTASEATDDFGEHVEHVSETLQNFRDEAQKSMDAVGEFRDSLENSTESVLSETDTLNALWEQLQDITDETGHVNDENIDLANTILGKLNGALGTEYSMHGDMIDRYKDMEEEIDVLISKKEALALADIWDEEFANTQNLLGNLRRQISEYEGILPGLESLSNMAAQGVGADILVDYAKQWGIIVETSDGYFENLANGVKYTDEAAAAAELSWANISDWYEGVTELYNAASNEALAYYEYIDRYERAQSALFEGDYEEAIAIMSSYSSARWNSIEEGQKLSSAELSQLKSDVNSAAGYMRWYYEQLEAGRAGFTEEGYQDAVDEWNRLAGIYEEHAEDLAEATLELADGAADAVTDAFDGIGVEMEDVGEDIVDGLAKGIDDNFFKIQAAAQRMSDAVPNKMRTSLEIASPSKLMKRLGGFVTEGFTEGIADKLGNLDETASSVAAAATAGFSTINNTSNSTTHNLGGITLVVNGAGIDNVDSLADIVSDRLLRQLQSERI